MFLENKVWKIFAAYIACTLFQMYYISSHILLIGRGIIFSGTKKENNNKNNTQDRNSDKRLWHKAR